MPEGQKVFHGEETSAGQGSVQDRGDMAFGEDKAVPIRVFGIFWIDPQFFVVEIGHEVRRGEAAAGMSALRAVRFAQNVFPDIDGKESQFLFPFRRHR